MIVCGCYGVKHDRFYLNCLSCGRVACELEVASQQQESSNDCEQVDVLCPYCNTSLLNIDRDSLVDKESIKRKERLLSYQRDSAKRTMVFDDHGDYFTTAEGSVWLTEEEVQMNQKKMEERQSEKEKATLDFERLIQQQNRGVGYGGRTRR